MMGHSEERFLRYMEAQRRCSPLTLRNYTADLVRLQRWVEQEYGPKKEMTELQHEEIREWVVALLDSGLKQQSVNRTLATLRSFFKWCEAEQIIKRNPMRKIVALKSPQPLPHFIPVSRMQSVLQKDSPESTTQENATPQRDSSSSAWQQQRNELIVEMLYATGLRLSEIASVTLNAFNSEMTTLRIVGKGNKERIVPIVDSLREKIRRHIEQLKANNIWNSRLNSLYLSKRTPKSEAKPLSTSMIYRIVREELSRAGVQGRKSPHVLRHTFATHLLNEGGDIRAIQELLGHASLTATQRYTHNSIANLQSIYETAHPRGADIAEGEE